MNNNGLQNLVLGKRLLNTDYVENKNFESDITITRPESGFGSSRIDLPLPNLFTGREVTKMSLNAVKLESV